MARVNDLIRQAKSTDPHLGAELEREFRALSTRRAFGLNFERHRPEAVELANRPVRRGDKVRVQPERGTTAVGDQRLWLVRRIERVDGQRLAHLVEANIEGTETRSELADDLLVIAEFRDPIYPGLTPTGTVTNAAEDVPAHTVINGENYHVLKALTYTHRGMIDAIYIDPPYNTGASDWKYNNDYVDKDDLYRHSKWLAFMERRLLQAKELLNPDDSVLIVTIDENEHARLSMLLEQTFPEAAITTVAIAINPKGTPDNGFARVEEYAIFLAFGSAFPVRVVDSMFGEEPARRSLRVRWRGLTRSGANGVRSKSPGAYYPIFIYASTGQIHSAGEVPPLEDDGSTVEPPEGTIAIWPTPRPDGTLGRWSVVKKKFEELHKIGAVKTGRIDSATGEVALSYLTNPNLRMIDSGEIVIRGHTELGAMIVEYSSAESKKTSAATVWSRSSHSASESGSNMLQSLLPARTFPYPKSLYAVEDALRLYTQDKPEAVILDFFAGSGTTAHAVMRLNKQDDGRRQCISVTNNEVAAEEQTKLRKQGLRPGDPDWEALGICEYVTMPRIAAAITGETLEGELIEGEYLFTDEFAKADGFKANAEFFTLTYEAPIPVGHNRAFSRIAPLLWLRAGAQGPRIDTISDVGWAATDIYGVLFDLDQAEPFAHAIEDASQARVAYVVTDDERRFQAVAQRLPDHAEPVRLYESYLSNFRFVNGE